MGELGVSHTRLVMPTRDNCAQLESLLEAAGALVETKKQVDRIEQEIRVLQERLGKASEGEGEGEGEGGDEEAMDVDEGEADGEADAEADGEADGEGEAADASEEARAQSIVSTRSGRSSRPRKQVNRARYSAS